jgi:hypothetical protein
MPASDETIRDVGLEAPRAKCIAPFPIAQLTEPLARPCHIGRRYARDELLVPAAIVELNEEVLFGLSFPICAGPGSEDPIAHDCATCVSLRTGRTGDLWVPSAD